MTNDATGEAILRTVRKIQESQASMETDMEKDRSGIQDLTVRLGAVEAELAQIRKAVNQNADRTRDKVAEAVEPVINSADRLTTSIKKSKKVFVKDERSFWDKFLGR